MGLTVGGSALVSRAYTAGNVRAFLHWFDPLWRLLEWLFLAFLLLVGKVIEPVVPWLRGQLSALAQAAANVQPGPQQQLAHEPSLWERIVRWLLLIITNAFVVVVLLAVLASAVGLLVLYLDKVRRSRQRGGAEEADAEQVTLGAGILGRGLQAVRDALGLARRFGISRQLLAAISVQNIYANLCRLARRRGRPRRPAQPPDAYLPTLQQVFPGQEGALGRITAAYMRVHYGDQPVTLAELAGLRADFQRVREGGDA